MGKSSRWHKTLRDIRFSIILALAFREDFLYSKKRKGFMGKKTGA